MRSDRFTVTVNRDFDAVLEGCAEPRPGRPRTWINARIRLLYRKLYERRHCHSLEVYDGETLVGGLYGVTLGRAFFGESMFHRARDASKVALVHLVARLKAGGFKLLDTQFVTDHLKTFGAIEVPRRQYHKLWKQRSRAKAISPRSASGVRSPARRRSRSSRGIDRLESDQRRGTVPCVGCCAGRRGAAGGFAGCADAGHGLDRRRGGDHQTLQSVEPDVVDRMLDRVQIPGSKRTSSR